MLLSAGKHGLAVGAEGDEPDLAFMKESRTSRRMTPSKRVTSCRVASSSPSRIFLMNMSNEASSSITRSFRDKTKDRPRS